MRRFMEALRVVVMFTFLAGAVGSIGLFLLEGEWIFAVTAMVALLISNGYSLESDIEVLQASNSKILRELKRI